jgi:hypothetical protein
VTSFSVRGSRNGSLVRVTWTDGRVGGDPPTVDLIEVEAQLATIGAADERFSAWFSERYGDAPPPDPLADPSAAWRLIANVIDVVNEVEGDAPAEALDVVRRKHAR